MPELSSFTTGGTVQAGSGLYIRRKADDDLLSLCLRGEYASVLSSRQVGKSSLMVNVALELSRQNVKSALVDLSSIGQSVDAAQWYNGILRAVADDLGLHDDLEAWTEEHSSRSHSERFGLFFRKFLLPQVSERVVIFFDEIDTTLTLPFTDDFFAAIRGLYNERSKDNRSLDRLSFVLVGVAIPADLVKDQKRTPYNIGELVNLDDFDAGEAEQLAAALGLSGQETRSIAEWACAWTGGHPYLTQRLLRAMAEDPRTKWSRADVDGLVERIFLGDESSRDSNLNNLASRLSTGTPYTYRMLTTYSRILGGIVPVFDEQRSLPKTYLKLFGVVKRRGPQLVVRNAIYRRVFDSKWVLEQKAIRQQHLARRANIVAALLFVIASAMGAYAWLKGREASREHQLRTQLEVQREEAERQRQLAVTQKWQADQARAEAEKQRQLAEDRGRLLALSARREGALAEEATKARREAENQRKLADQNAAKALTSAFEAQAIAAENQKLAESETVARGLAEKNASDASNAAEKAKTLNIQLRGYKLAGDADLIRVQQPESVEQAMLLDIESYNRLQSLDARQGLLALGSGLEKLPKTVAVWKNPNKISALSLNQDGSLLMAGDATGRVLRVNLPGGQEAGEVGNLKGVAAVAAGPDSIAFDETGRAPGWPLPPEAQRLLAVRSDAKGYAAVLDSDARKLNYWQAGSASPHVLHHHARVLLAAFGNEHLYTFCDDSTVYLWSMPSFNATRIAIPRDQPPGQVKFLAVREAPLPTLILGSGSNIRVYITRGSWSRWLLLLTRITYSAQLTFMLSHEAPVTAVAINPSSSFLTTATGTTLRRWNVVTGREVFRINPGGNGIGAIALSADDRFVAAAQYSGSVTQRSGSVTIWRAEAGVVVSSLPLATFTPMPIAFSSDGEKLTVTDGREFSSWDWRQNTKQPIVTATIAAAANSLNGAWSAQLIAESVQRSSASQPPLIRLKPSVPAATKYLIFRDLSTGREVSRTPVDVTASGLDISPDGQFAALTVNQGAVNQGVKVYRATGEEVPGFDYSEPERIDPLAIAPQAAFLAAGRPGGVDIIQKNKVIAVVQIPNPRSLFFSNDGKYLAVGTAGGARLVPVGQWQNPQALSAAGTLSLAFSPDSGYLAIRETESSVRIVAIGGPTPDSGVVLQLPFAFTRMAFSPDHKYLATSSTDGIRVLPWQASDLIEEACQRVHTKSLSPVQWTRYLNDEPQTSTTCPAQK